MHVFKHAEARVVTVNYSIIAFRCTFDKLIRAKANRTRVLGVIANVKFEPISTTVDDMEIIFAIRICTQK